MKILRVAQKLYPEHKGGGAYHVHAMSRDQAAMGHDVTVLTVSDDDSLPRREDIEGYKVVRARSTAELLGNTLSVGLARELRKANDYDVIHAHSHIYFSTNLAALKRQFSEIPLAITNHGLYSQNAPKWLFDGYLRTIGRWTFNAADVVFCYTTEDRTRVSEFGVDTDIAVVPNGVDTTRFTPDGPSSDLIEHDGAVVLFVGRLVEGKRPQDAIDAVAGLPDELNAKCYVVGDGPLREKLAAGGGDAVEFLGHVPYDEMPAVYRAGDVLLLTSRAEGFPRTVLEAFASGVPVISSHLEHTAGLIQEGGETVPLGDVKEYADALEHLIRNPPDRENIREVVLLRHDWDETVAKTTAVLESIQ